MTRVCTVGKVTIGPLRPLAIIAGPCVLESLELGMTIGSRLVKACAEYGLAYVFKASFDKANRSSVRSARGPGLEGGLAWMSRIRSELGVPVTTDIHEPEQAALTANVVDLLQIPAFLCRQTDLLCAAGEAAVKMARAVNVKKGQFLAPHEMAGAVRKLAEVGCTNVMVTERGTTFGYGRLVNDFLGLGDLMELRAEGGSPPVCFDVTHSTQLPGAGEQTGGRPDRAPLLARAAAAAGVHAMFLETHPQPGKALSDASTMLPLDSVPELLRAVAKIREAIE
ncbi:2-dehydro-3-deoxyphosphooctonate aldolase (KDO 8-P synthase) [Phycisphaerales bacterium]|nr:2-dehydro-3-deoxyphosphooctonate aldolase (KDO 8-P synthase) [Phycisphaerales bacterium]